MNTPESIVSLTKKKMEKSLENLKVEFSKIRTGRAHPGILDHLMIDYYGSPTPITQLAKVNLIDSRTLSVTPWEKPMIAQIEKAIMESDLGLNPNSVGELIRVPMPALTEERRKELTRVAKSQSEDSKVAIRNIRREANEGFKKLVKDKEISSDEEKRFQDSVQKMTDKFVKVIDELLTKKETDILTV
ncbi:MAG: ribosome recycling factor [Betaproteobacteria bacterium TMED156]|nr:MAG: ribosome recycling factor [Betaproteobacteria bacterium TMED156]|tara:strand:+ start:512 stop:1075 length:564 start_codon:yes stop_codon:yes gene_type:complete